jgi:hypothetical protein
LVQLEVTLLLMVLLLLAVVVAQVFTTQAFQSVGLMVDQEAEEPHQAGQVAQEYRGKALRAVQVAQGRILAEAVAQGARQAHKPQV